jgi:hypothetical protein
VPIITNTPITGFAHCAQQIDEHGELAYDVNGTPNGEDRCPGYKQAPVAAIRETTEWLFGDYSNGTGDVMDQALANNVSHSHIRSCGPTSKTASVRTAAPAAS